MKRVTGIGGIFFKCKDPGKTKEWYQKHLGIKSDQYGAKFAWRENEKPENICYTVWSPFDEDTSYFQPAKKDFMFNYRVNDLSALIDELRKEGVQIVGEIEEYEYGKFGWIMDPDGNKIELWEPVDNQL